MLIRPVFAQRQRVLCNARTADISAHILCIAHGAADVRWADTIPILAQLLPRAKNKSLKGFYKEAVRSAPTLLMCAARASTRSIGGVYTDEQVSSLVHLTNA
jgi:hypothetical protein